MELKSLISVLREENCPATITKQLEKLSKLTLENPKNWETMASAHSKLLLVAVSPLTDALTIDTRVKLRDYLAELGFSLAETRRQAQNGLGKKLSEAAAELGFAVEGNYQRLIVGFFQISIDFELFRARIWYGPEQVKLPNAPADADAIYEVISKRMSKLGSGKEPHEFASIVESALHLSRMEAPQAQLGLLNLLPWVAFLIQDDKFRKLPLGSKFRSYDHADFSFDLYRCWEEVTKRISLRTAVRKETSKGDFLWIPKRKNIADGGYWYQVGLQQ